MADQLTGEQIEELKECFSLIDQSGDGKISLGELGPALKSFSKEFTEDDIKAAMEAFDADGSGSIEFQEFLAIVANMIAESERQKEEDLRNAFDMCDTDGSGAISKAELRSLVEALGEKLTSKEIDDLLKAADSDGDDRVTFEEFKQFLS